MLDPGLHVRLEQTRPISLDAQLTCLPGELLALVGPSGSGKTTILRCIAGLHRPAGGRVCADGAVWLDTVTGIHRVPQDRSVGLVFQSYALFPHLTAQANVAAALSHRPAAQRDRRARDLLAMVHLAGLEHRYPATLSGGQQQRVALARALARDPSVLLLDEPFSAVDQMTRRKLQRELAHLRQQLNLPIVLVTHDLGEARNLADRMAILHGGRTLQSGPPAELMSRPASPLVARLLDSRNIFEARVKSQRAADGTTLLETLGRTLEAAHDPRFSPGDRVTWVIPGSSIVLHRRDRPSRGERENPVPGEVSELVVLGDNAAVTLALDGRRDRPLSFTLPLHAARRNGLEVGRMVTVSLLARDIHLMPEHEPRHVPEPTGMTVDA